jgi:transcription-repair coupling factor (superfamily II helicase)
VHGASCQAALNDERWNRTRITVRSESGRRGGTTAVDRPELVARARARLDLPDTRGAGRQAVGGVCPGARALAVAALLEQRRPAVVVVPSPRDADELVAGLALIDPGLPAAAFPAEAVAAYQGRPAPLGATAAASLALLGLGSGTLAVLVVPARALPFPLPHPAALPTRCPRIAAGARLDPAALAASLVEAGYRRTEVVEEAGEFALRGQVIDLGTPERFVRIVLEVDVAEAVREFDPASQRSLAAELDEFLVPPLRLFPAGAAERAALAARLDADGCPAAAAAARDGRDPGWWEPLLGLAQPHLAVWAIADTRIVCEREAVRAEVERALAALRHARQALAADGVSLPGPEAWLADGERCAGALADADVVEELMVEDGTVWARLDTVPVPVVAARPQLLREELSRNLAAGRSQAVVAASPGEAQRLLHLLADADLPATQGWPGRGEIGVVAGELAHGFAWPAERFVLFGRADVTTLPAPARRRRALAVVLAAMRDLAAGDFVVHAEHGIGRFRGFRSFDHDGLVHECVELEYAGGGTLLVPLERADVLEKYSGAEGPPPRLDRLGGASWQRTRARVKRALKDMAEELLRLQAQREVAPGFAFAKDSPWQREFEEAFEYELTPDQDAAIRDAKRDMEASRPMDRLLVGDVGYGKTEVAMRAAFKAVMDGKQVAVLAPTTILAEQHLRTFRRRFAGFPVEIRWLSRFLSTAEQRAVARGLADGSVDVVIGTHRLLARDVTFRDLGLLVVDEEQRFGVAQKEKLKTLKATVDVIALSATPIPRTLNLGLLGLRDISVIETPPRDRLAVQTHVLPFSREVVREAILTELARGGQVFFVHNRIASIPAIARLLAEIAPEARIAVAHGQMDENELERAMDAFLERRADLLLATAIIENGLDIGNANTLLVSRADRFGLAQLYQLRGRVGRSDRLAFAYLLVPPDRSLTEEARRRLAAIQEFADLGAGFRIAARDLEIRGAGNLLGAEQHGHLRAVGYETYCRLLEEVVQELKGEAAAPPPSACDLRLGLDLRLPERFIPEETLRLVVYRRIAGAQDDAELDALRAEFADRFGAPPAQLDHLLVHQRLRRRAEASGVTRVRRTVDGFELQLDAAHPAAHPLALHLLAGAPASTLSPAGTLRLPLAERDGARAAARLLELIAP